jgi:hypothetical protein
LYCKRTGVSAGVSLEKEMVRLVGVEPTTGKSPADFKPAAYANFATAAPGVTRPQQNNMQAEMVARQERCRGRISG